MRTKPFLPILMLSAFSVFSQHNDSTLLKEIQKLNNKLDDYQHSFDQVLKGIDDVLWFERVSDVAYIDKVRIASTPRWKPRTPDDRFAGNKLQIYV